MLADQLTFHKVPENAVVVALPRGGVPVGFAIAERLHIPLDVAVARKLGVPWQPELAMGAIAGTVRVLDEHLIQELAIGHEEVDSIVSREQAEMNRREELYHGGALPLDLRGRSVILVDDGIAMGSTMTAAARYVKSLGPEEVIIAVPSGSRQTCMRLISEVDDLVCLAAPEPFYSVGQWYLDFHQVSDIEVQDLLARSRHLVNTA